MARDLAADSDRNLWETWRHFGRVTSGVEEDDDVLIVETGALIPTFNPVFVRRVPDDAISLVRRAIDRALPVVITVNPAVRDLDRLLEAADETGLTNRGHLPGMALPDLVSLDGSALVGASPEGLVISEVHDRETWTTYFDVVCSSFGVPVELVAPLTEPSVYDGNHITAFLGAVGGQPVATSLAVVVDDTVGVYNVATLESHRRRGYGEAMTWAAALWGRDRGCAVAVLQSSAMGRGVYERMGFVEVVPYLQLVPAA